MPADATVRGPRLHTKCFTGMRLYYGTKSGESPGDTTQSSYQTRSPQPNFTPAWIRPELKNGPPLAIFFAAVQVDLGIAPA
jgi:hypothetical protein